MHIVHCIPSLEGGGAEAQLALIAAGQAKRGRRVTVVTAHSGEALGQYNAARVRVVTLRKKGNHDPRLGLRLLRFVLRERPHVVQTWLPQMDVMGGCAALIARVPWVLTERSSAPAYRARAKDRLLRATVGRAANAVVANSVGGAEYWRALTGGRQIVHVVPNAIPLERIDAVVPHISREDTRGATASPVILAAGRLVAEKNFQDLLVAFARLRNGMQARLVICGEGPFRDELERRVAELGVQDAVELLGFRGDLWRRMKASDVFVHPSSFEGQPNVVLEAMACGVPLIVSDIPAHRELLTAREALFYDMSSPDALATALRETLCDQEGAKRRVQAAYLRVRDFSPDVALDGYDAVYERLIGAA